MSDELTDKQRRFVAEYVVDGNAAAAAVRAGYSPRTAKQAAYTLMQRRVVAEAIAKRQERILNKAEVTAEDIVRRAWEIAQGEQLGPAVSALSLLAKRHPEFSDKQEITGKDGAPLSLTIGGRLKRDG